MIRRDFLKGSLAAMALLAMTPSKLMSMPRQNRDLKDPLCTVYRSMNGSPDENIQKVLEMMGGIEKMVEPDAVVLIKPNVQWWNQGAPNLLSLKAFVDMIMNRPGGFSGEVVIAENNHRGATPWEHSGWAKPFDRNSDIAGIQNYNGLSLHLKKRYEKRFSTCHWIDVGAGGRRVFGPNDGAGYVYCDGTGGVPLLKLDNGASGADKRSVIMTYPVFKTDKGTVIDFKNGIWEKGSYTGQPLRFINFAALNHHSSYCGATSAVKNYLGISDLSGGPDPHQNGRLTEKYYNFHSFPFNKWSAGPVSGMIGAEIGAFMNSVRKADLNITTADWVGLASRTEPPVARTKAVLASTDPVALDYHASKYLLYPNSGAPIHDPDNARCPMRHYLLKCAEAGGGVADETRVEVKTHDFRKGPGGGKDSLAIRGEIEWGSNPREIAKYLYFRYLHNG